MNRSSIESIAQLRRRLAEAEETLHAIREGQVDAVVVKGRNGEQIYSLKETENIYRLMIETIRQPAVALARDGTIVFFNDCLRELVGRPPDQITGRPLVGLIDSADQSKLRAMLRRAHSTQSADASVALRTPAGLHVPVHWRANRLRHVDGPLTCLVGTDLTQLQASEETIHFLKSESELLTDAQLQLEASRQYYADLFNLAPVGFLTLTLDGCIREINSIGARLLGLAPSRVLGRPFRLMISMQDRRRFLGHLRRLRRGERTSSEEFMIAGQPEHPTWVQIVSTIVHPPLKSGRQVNLVMLDITARKQAQQTIQSQAARLHLVTEITPVMLTQCSQDLRFTFVNRAYADFLGLPPQQIAGKPIVEIIGREAYRVIRPYVQLVLRGQSADFELEVPYSRVGPRVVHATYQPDKDEQGRVRGWVESIQDVTQRRNEEQRLRLRDSINRALAESLTLEEAAPNVIEALCAAGGWESGAIWNLDGAANELVCVEFWHVPSLAMPAFETETRRRRFAPGHGLPGRVWSQARPIWIPEVGRDGNFLRARAARQSGLHGGFAFPIALGDEVLSVVECFSRQSREPDADMLRALEAVSSKLGQFIKRQNTEAALRESEERLRLLIDTALDAVVTFDGAGKITDWNAEAAMIFGWSKAEVMGRSLAETIIPPHDRTRLRRDLRQYRMTSGGPLFNKRVETAALHRSGRVFPAELAMTFVIVNNRASFSAFVRDITRRRQAEEALRQAHDELERRVQGRTAELTKANAALQAEMLARQQAQDVLRQSEKELADFFEQSPLGLLWVRPDGTIQRVNKAQLDLLGRRADECQGRFIGEFFVDPGVANQLLARLANKETVQNFGARIRGLEGAPRHALVDANGLWEHGRLIHSRWFVRDITRRVELEQEILTIAEREQQRIGHDLHDDLCQQLAGIEFLSQTLARQLATLAPEGARRAGEIAGMVRQAMTHTRELAHGLSPLGAQAGGLMDALQSLAGRVRTLFNVNCQFHCEAPVLVHDPTVRIHLYRIAQEGVSNAFRRGKSTRIDLHLSRKGKVITLAVKDNGIGLPPVPVNTNGIGLRVMRLRASVIGGTLLVERGQHGGTTLVCTLKQALRPSVKDNANERH
jgi:PAS domain S-box-containing protein